MSEPCPTCGRPTGPYAPAVESEGDVARLRAALDVAEGHTVRAKDLAVTRLNELIESHKKCQAAEAKLAEAERELAEPCDHEAAAREAEARAEALTKALEEAHTEWRAACNENSSREIARAMGQERYRRLWELLSARRDKP